MANLSTKSNYRQSIRSIRQVFNLLTALFCLFSMPSFVRADDVVAGARMLCTDRSVIIQFAHGPYGGAIEFPNIPIHMADTFEDANEYPSLECTLTHSNNQTVRLKINRDQATGHGMCDGARQFFSLWIDRHQVFSDRPFVSLCFDPNYDVAAIVFHQGLYLCAFPYYDFARAGAHLYENLAASDPDLLACINVSDQHLAALDRPVDQVEYPADGSDRREDFVDLTASLNDGLCGYFESILNAGQGGRRGLLTIDRGYFIDRLHPPEQFTLATGLSNRRTKISLGYTAFLSDINNDGFDDLIGIASRGRWDEDQYLLMVVDGSEGDVSADMSLPPHGRRTPYSMAEPILFGGLVKLPDSSLIHNSYGLAVFGWLDETYIYMQGVFDKRSPDYKILKMLPDGSTNTICELNYIDIHY